jgi:hypothetical protein
MLSLPSVSQLPHAPEPIGIAENNRHRLYQIPPSKRGLSPLKSSMDDSLLERKEQCCREFFSELIEIG